MAQTGYSSILLYASGTAGNKPSASRLTNSSAGAELALNYADGILYYKTSGGTVTAIANAVTGGGSLPGGAAGQIPYQSAPNTTAFTAAGTTGQILISGGTGSPTWASLSSTVVQTFSGGTTGLTPATATSGAIILGGTLATSNGGTGLTGFTAANNALYSTSSSVLVAGTLPVAAGGSGVTVSSGANSIVLRDANVNVSANSFLSGFNSTAAGGSTVVLTAASAPYQLITGSGNQTFQLPDATTLSLGTTFSFNNNSSSGSVSINNNSSTLVASVGSGGYINLELLTNSNAAGTWDKHYQTPSNVSWTTSSLTYNGTYTGGGTWNGNAIGVAYGGTGLTSLTAGSLVYGNGTSAMNTLPIGTAGQVLTVNPGGTAPIWSSIGSSAVTTFSGGTTGLTPSTPSTGAITLGGTLATANGGTGLTTFTSGGAVYATSTSALTTGILPIASGGTNSSATPTLGGVAYGTGSAIAVTAAGTTGQVLISNAGSAPSWGSVGIANGGTGASTASAAFNALSPITSTGDLIIGTGTNTASRLPIGTNGYVLTSNGTTASWQVSTGGVSQIVAGTNVTISPSGGTGVVTINAAGLNAAYTRTSFTASAGQTTFSVIYTVGYLEVFLNGVFLNGSDYTATNGTSMQLAVGCSAGDIVETIAYNTQLVTTTNADSINGGAAGELLYQTGANATGFTGVGTSGQALLSGGTSSPTWGTLAITAGGTGATSKSAGFNALSPITTTGDLIIGTGTNSSSRLAIGSTGYVLTSDGTTASWQAAASSGVTSFSAGSTGLTPSSATTGALTLGGTLNIASGGTGATTKAAAFNALNPMTTAGDIIYEASAGTAARLALGTAGQVLTVVGSIPSWADPVQGTVTSVSFSGGLISVATPSTTPALTVAGTSGGVVFFSSSNAWASSGVLTQYGVMYGGGAGSAPQATTTGTAGQALLSGGASSTPAYGTLGISAGGTGTTSAAAAFNALNPMTTTGDLIYESATNTASRLAVGTTGQVLTVVSGVPAWANPTGAVTQIIAGTNITVSPSGGTGAVTINATLPTATYTRTSFTATSGQTTFTVSYTVGYVEVFLNGVFLNGSDYTATNGTSIVLAVGASTGDIVEVIAYSVVTISNTTANNLNGGSPGSVVWQSASGITAFTSPGTTGQVLLSNGTSAPSFGTLGISYGGTGATTATAGFNALSPIANTGDLIIGNGSNSATRLGIGLNGYVLTSNGTTASWQAATASGVSSFSAGTTGLTPNSATTGAIVLGGTLAIANGGTGATTASAAFNALSPITSVGDLIIGTGVNTGSRLAIGTNGYVLTSNGTTASWAANNAGTVTSVSFTGGIINVATSTTTPALTVAGTSGGIPYFSSASTWASSAALTQYGVVYGGGAGASPAATASGTSGQPLLSGGSGAAPAYGTLGISYGGTGQTTAAAAFNALNPMTTTGDIIYESGTNTAARLGIGTTGQVLRVVSGVPAWSADVSQIVAGTNITISPAGGTGAVTINATSTATAYTRTSFTATSGQTSFTVSYTVGYIQVFLNGVFLNGSDYTATSGTTVVLAVGASTGDIVEVIAFNVINVATNVQTTYVPASGTANGNATLYLTNGVTQLFTSSATANWTQNIAFSNTVSLNSFLSAGQTITITGWATMGATPYYMNGTLTIDGTSSGVTTYWQGGSAPSTGHANQIDAYTYVVTKTANATYTVLASQVQF